MLGYEEFRIYGLGYPKFIDWMLLIVSCAFVPRATSRLTRRGKTAQNAFGDPFRMALLNAQF